MENPFDVMKYEDRVIIRNMSRFIDLYAKYKDNIDEVLELAELYNRFCPNKKNKYCEDI